MSRKMMSDLDNKTGYYGYSSESGNVSGKDKKKKENKGGSVLGVILALIQLVLSGLLVYQVVSANILSTTYLAVLVIVLVVLFAIALLTQKGGRPARTSGKILSVIISIILGILLGLVLLFTALVLCVPVRYRAAGDNHEKIQYSFKVSWLLSIIAVKKKKDSEQIVFSVFGIPIKRMGNEKPVKKTVVKSEKEKEPEPLQDNKEETGEPVLAAQEEKKKQRKDKKKRTFSRTKKAKKKKSKKNFSFQGLSSIMKCVKQNKKLLKRLYREIKELLKYLAPKKVRGTFAFGTGDPSSTGLVTGLISLFPIAYQEGVYVTPDFEEKRLAADFFVKGSFRLIYFFRRFLRLYLDKELKRMWKQIHRLKKEAF